MESEVNPFDGQEAKPYDLWHPLWSCSLIFIPLWNSLNACRYKNDPEILAMTNLIAAYQKNDIMEFEKILKVSVLEHMIFLVCSYPKLLILCPLIPL
jgi:hypothetical protein